MFASNSETHTLEGRSFPRSHYAVSYCNSASECAVTSGGAENNRKHVETDAQAVAQRRKRCHQFGLKMAMPSLQNSGEAITGNTRQPKTLRLQMGVLQAGAMLAAI